MIFRLCLVFCLFVFPWRPVDADPLTISITEGTFQPSPCFVLLSGPNQQLRDQIIQVIEQDLGNCGLFECLSTPFLPQTADEAFTDPRWSSWQQTGAHFLITGDVSVGDEGRLTVRCRILDILNQKELSAFSVSTQPKQSRRLGHQIADEAYKHVTGSPGYFDTQIAYVAAIGPGQPIVRSGFAHRMRRPQGQRGFDPSAPWGWKKNFRICLMDQDGANHRILKIKGDFLKGPKISPDGKRVLYIANDIDASKESGSPQAFVYDITSGIKRRIPTGGKVFAAEWIPGQSDFLLSVQKDKQTVLGVYNESGGLVRALIQSKGIDTSPSVSADGQFVVFVSDRGGPPHLYRMPLTGGAADPLNFSPGKDSHPSYSSKSNQIAFIRQKGGFHLMVLTPEGTERALAHHYLVDTPEWAPNGEGIVFSAKTSAKAPAQLYVVNSKSLKICPIPTPDDACEPSWSLLP